MCSVRVYVYIYIYICIHQHNLSCGYRGFSVVAEEGIPQLKGIGLLGKPQDSEPSQTDEDIRPCYNPSSVRFVASGRPL